MHFALPRGARTCTTLSRAAKMAIPLGRQVWPTEKHTRRAISETDLTLTVTPRAVDWTPRVARTWRHTRLLSQTGKPRSHLQTERPERASQVKSNQVTGINMTRYMSSQVKPSRSPTPRQHHKKLGNCLKNGTMSFTQLPRRSFASIKRVRTPWLSRVEAANSP